MPEKRLCNFMCIEGMIMLILGLCILIIPKLTELSFTLMVSIAFIIYGVCKFVCSIINRDFMKNFLCEMFLGVYLVVIGILLALVPRTNIYWLIALIGAYFILETASATSFLAQVRKTFNYWYLKLIIIAIIFIAGLYILVKQPDILFAKVAMIVGACYLLKGNCKMMLAKLNKEIEYERNEDKCDLRSEY